jgi:hypothetical protein
VLPGHRIRARQESLTASPALDCGSSRTGAPKRAAEIGSYRRETKDSTVRPDCRMIARNVPRSSSLWSGTTNCANGSLRRRMMWLPSCRRTKKPAFSRARTHPRPETRGSLLTRLRAWLRNGREGPTDGPLRARRCSHEWPPLCSPPLPPASSPARCSRADSDTPKPSSRLHPGKQQSVSHILWSIIARPAVRRKSSAQSSF